jgi:hypothetical protein
MTLKDAFKAYYITHYLLQDFQEKGGFCAMLAEEELFLNICDWLQDKVVLSSILDDIKFVFGLSERDLKAAVKDYEKYKKEMEE